MIWPFSSKEPEPDETYHYPPRAATDEFLYGLREIAEIYNAREKQNRAGVIETAKQLSEKTYFNYQELDRFLNAIRLYMVDAIDYQGKTAEIRNWIQGYEYRGHKPRHMREIKMTTPANAVFTTANTIVKANEKK